MRLARPHLPFFFFFNDTATTEIYTLSLHDALPISSAESAHADRPYSTTTRCRLVAAVPASAPMRPAGKSTPRQMETPGDHPPRSPPTLAPAKAGRARAARPAPTPIGAPSPARRSQR